MADRLVALALADDAEALCIEQVERYRRTHGDDDPRTWQANASFAGVLHRSGRSAVAEPLARVAVEG